MTVFRTASQWQIWLNTPWQARHSLLLCLKAAHALVAHDSSGRPATEFSDHKVSRNHSGVSSDQNTLL
jgi:hypothetical protein